MVPEEQKATSNKRSKGQLLCWEKGDILHSHETMKRIHSQPGSHEPRRPLSSAMMQRRTSVTAQQDWRFHAYALQIHTQNSD